MEFQIHSVGFGDTWNEIVFSERRDVSPHVVRVQTMLVEPLAFRDAFDPLKRDITQILNEAFAQFRGHAPQVVLNPEEPIIEPRVMSGAEYRDLLEEAKETTALHGIQGSFFPAESFL